MDLSIITVTWNAKENISEQIESVFRGCKNIRCEEIISDNGSQDDTVEIAVGTGRDLSAPVQVIENGANIGFGSANNKGLKIAQGEFLLFLNPDMRVEEGSLDVIVEWMRQHPDVGIVSPKLVDQFGKFNWDASPRRFPKVWEQVLLLLKVPHFVPTLLDRYLMKDFNPELEQEVDSVRGSFMLVRRDLIKKLGWGFDPRYFFWFEDVDTCRECWKAGYKVMYTPIITAVDYVGQSFKKRKSYWKQKNFSKSMLTYFRKWEPWYKWMWIAVFRPVGMGVAFLVDLFR
ncbi:MAG: glycosyltransferase family 2 protein [Candidatus Magasanikbacteria bacterium]|nr:glycosyltransferase family 2 protein [Candidatus Magasanikbacteria bacterium]